MEALTVGVPGLARRANCVFSIVGAAIGHRARRLIAIVQEHLDDLADVYPALSLIWLKYVCGPMRLSGCPTPQWGQSS